MNRPHDKPITLTLLIDPINKRPWSTQYTRFIDLFDEIINIPPPQFKHLSFCEFHGRCFNIFHTCEILDQDKLKYYCTEYIINLTTHLNYPQLTILSQLLSYLIANNSTLGIWFGNKIKLAKRNSRTLMELCQNTIQQHQYTRDEYNQFSHSFKGNIARRIKNYYFE